MSETYTYVGVLYKMDGDPEQIAKEILLKRDPNYVLDWDSWLEDLQEIDGYEKWHVINGVLYQSEHIKTDHEGVYHATIKPNGDIEYAVQFYNGGCCMTEALERAIKLSDKPDNEEKIINGRLMCKSTPNGPWREVNGLVADIINKFYGLEKCGKQHVITLIDQINKVENDNSFTVGHKGPGVGCWSHPNVDDGKLQLFDER